MALSSLGVLVTNLRMEAGQSSNPAAGTNQRDQLVYILNRTQEELANDYVWPFLEVDRDVPISVGTRYYAYPADLPFENITNAWLVWNTLYGKLHYGIGPAQFALWNSNVGFKSWPVERWKHNADTNLFEVWPIPSEAPAASASSQAALVRLRGTKLVPWMVADGDLCTFPDTMLVLFAAAELLAATGSKVAPLKLAKAKEALRRYRLRVGANKREPFVMGAVERGQAHGRIGLEYIPPGYGNGPGQ